MLLIIIASTINPLKGDFFIYIGKKQIVLMGVVFSESC